MMEHGQAGFTIKKKVYFKRNINGAKQMCTGKAPTRPAGGRIPRITRLMALAIQYDTWVRSGEVTDYAKIAKLGHVSRARLTQIMNLNLLATSIQEDILFLPKVIIGHDPITEHDIRKICQELSWENQKQFWGKLTKSADLGIQRS